MGKLPTTIKGFFYECPKCGDKYQHLPYVAVRYSEENPNGTFTVYVTCQRCLLNFTVWNYKPKAHQLPKK